MENKAELRQEQNNKGKLFNDELVQRVYGTVSLAVYFSLPILMYLNFVGFLLE